MPAKDPFFQEVVKVVGFGAIFASIPLFASMENLQPPWPTAVAYISAAVILVGALLVREFGEGATRRTRRRLLLLASGFTVLGLFAYLFLYAWLVLTLESEDRLVRGFACTSEAREMFASCPHLSEADIADAGYDPGLVYTPASLLLAKLSLVAAWMLFTAGLVAAAGWAIVGRRREFAEPEAPSPPGD